MCHLLLMKEKYTVKTVTFHNLNEKFVKNLSIDEATYNYKIQINLIKEGLYKG